jgi:hypothetical protein
MASIMASRAFARASLWYRPAWDVRRAIDDRISRPTAITVSKIIRENVITKAKPLFRRTHKDGGLNAILSMGFADMSS